MADAPDPLPLAQRTAHGTLGRRTTVYANAFPVRKFPNIIVHHYDVTITPVSPPLPSKVGREFFAHLNDKMKVFGNDCPVYDGKKNIYSPKLLPFGNFGEFSVYMSGTGVINDEQKGRKFGITIKKVAEVNLIELYQHFGVTKQTGSKSIKQLAPNPRLQSVINALQLVLIHQPFLLHTNHKTSFFPDPSGNSKVHLGKAIDMWRGWSISLRPAPGKLIVNIDLAALPMIQSGNLLDVVCLHLGRGQNTVPHVDVFGGRGISDQNKLELDRLLKGVTISVRGTEKDGSPRIRKFKAKGLSSIPANKDFFEMISKDQFGKEKREKISVARYWEREMNKRLEFPGYPTVKGNGTAKIPLEVCTVELRQKWTRKLTPEQIRNALAFTQKSPSERGQFTRSGVEYIYPDSASSVPKKWGIEIDKTNMIKVNARQLAPPALRFSGPAKVMEGQWNMKGLKYALPATLKNFLVVNFDPYFTDNQINACVDSLIRACKDAGMEIGPRLNTPQGSNIARWAPARGPPGDRDKAGPAAFLDQTCGAGMPVKPEMVIAFLPVNSTWHYAQVKRWGDSIRGVATQCLSVPQFTSKRSPGGSYWSNVALKVNVKLGGRNHVLSDEALGPIAQKPTIVFGADVNHPGSESFAPSIAAVCASLDKWTAAYGSALSVQSSRVEMIDDLRGMVMTLLRQFYRKNREKPSSIIFFRDGVSEGQFQQCLAIEVSQIFAACASLEPNYKPALTFIVVGKRHNFRFLPTETGDNDKTGNVKAGTVIDTEIVSPFEFDWYLNSHAGRLGTSKSSHYTVLRDDSKFSADQLQTMCYNLCYSYARSTRSVSISAPAYYAHHVAYRAKLLLTEDGSIECLDNGSELTEKMKNQRQTDNILLYRKRLPKVHANLSDRLYFM